MSWRVVVVTGVAKLDLKMGFLVVRKEATTRIHLSEIHTLLVDSTAVSLTTALLNELIREKIKVIFCDEAHNPASELIALHGSHDSSMKIKMQIGWPNHIREAVWTEIVAEKIRKQSALLRHYGLEDRAGLLDTYLQELMPGDRSNREAHAAKVYFGGLFGDTFTRTEDCIENAALNYGYSILLSAFNREIAANGYLTQLGIFHDNRFNSFNLACDLMEPYRPLVDRLVVESEFEFFDHDEKMKLVDLLNQQIQINGSVQRVINAIRIYCKSVFNAINQQDLGLLQFYSNEL